MTAVGEGEEGVDLRALEDGFLACGRDGEMPQVSFILSSLFCLDELNQKMRINIVACGGKAVFNASHEFHTLSVPFAVSLNM